MLTLAEMLYTVTAAYASEMHPLCMTQMHVLWPTRAPHVAQEPCWHCAYALLAQASLFALFSQYLDAYVAVAKSKAEYDDGIINLKAESIALKSTELIHEEPGTGVLAISSASMALGLKMSLLSQHGSGQCVKEVPAKHAIKRSKSSLAFKFSAEHLSAPRTAHNIFSYKHQHAVVAYRRAQTAKHAGL